MNKTKAFSVVSALALTAVAVAVIAIQCIRQQPQPESGDWTAPKDSEARLATHGSKPKYSRTILIRVMDWLTHAPIEHAECHIELPGSPPGWSGESDAEGNATLQILSEMTNPVLTVTHAFYETDRHELEIALPTKSEVVELHARGLVAGRIEDGNGLSIPGAEVWLLGYSRPLQRKTSDDGTFAFDSLPPDSVVKIAASALGHETVTREIRVTIATAPIVVALPIRMMQTIYVEAPEVVGEHSLELHLRSSRQLMFGGIVTIFDGRGTIAVPATPPEEVAAGAATAILPTGEVEGSIAVPPDEQGSSSRTVVRFASLLSARLAFKKGGDALREVSIYVRRIAGGPRSLIGTDASGSADLLVGPAATSEGDPPILFWSTDGMSSSVRTSSLVQAARDGRTVEIELASGPGQLIVLVPAEYLTPNAPRFEIYEMSTGKIETFPVVATSEKPGSIVFAVPAGTYGVMWRGRTLMPGRAVVSEGGRGTLDLSAALARGKVTGLSAPRAVIQAWDASTATVPRQVASGVGDGDGRFSLELLPGKYRIDARLDPDLIASDIVSVRSGETTSTRSLLGSGMSGTTVRVLNSAGEPVRSLSWTAWEDNYVISPSYDGSLGPDGVAQFGRRGGSPIAFLLPRRAFVLLAGLSEYSIALRASKEADSSLCTFPEAYALNGTPYLLHRMDSYAEFEPMAILPENRIEVPANRQRHSAFVSTKRGRYLFALTRTDNAFTVDPLVERTVDLSSYHSMRYRVVLGEIDGIDVSCLRWQVAEGVVEATDIQLRSARASSLRVIIGSDSETTLTIRF
jgi:hypothetical protein